MDGYRHTQHGPWWWLLAALAAVSLAAWQWLPVEGGEVVFGGAALVFVLLASMLAQLTVRDGGDALLVRFGPLPLWGTSVRYDRILEVRRARSSWLDGWGVHWVPGRGWTFNLYGRDCVEVRTARGCVRIGTDDVDGLLAFLRARTGAGVTDR